MTSRHSRTAIAAACRKPMQAGRLRPTMRACCARAGNEREAPGGDDGEAGEVRHGYRACLRTISERAPAGPCCSGARRRASARIGNIAKAAHYELQLAEIETRAPEAWAVDAPAEGCTP